MWLPWERDRLLVYADELQARGDPLGELIVSAHTLETDAEPRPALEAEVASLEAKVADPRLDELLRTLVVLQPRWESGVIVELRVADGPRPEFSPQLHAALDELVEHPRVRMIQTLELPYSWFFLAFARACDVTLAPVEELLDRRWAGLMPRAVRISINANDVAAIEFDDRHPAAHVAFEARRGLFVLFHGRRAVCLSRLGPKQNNSRALQLEAHLARDPLDPAIFTRFARAFWDDSRSVRDVALAALPRYGLELAALIPDLLRLHCSDREWLTRLREAVAALALQAELVEATAPGLDLRVVAHRRWLEASARPDAAERQRGRRRAQAPERSQPIWTELDDGGVERIVAMPDDHLLVEIDVSRYQIRALDGRALAELQLDSPADALEVFRDGSVALAAAPGVWVWRPRAGEVLVAQLEVEALALTVLAPDRVLIACDDGSLREWTIDDDAELARFDDLGELEGGGQLLDPEGFVFDPVVGVTTRVWGAQASRVVGRIADGYGYRYGFRRLERLLDGRVLGLVTCEGLYLWTLESEAVDLERRVADTSLDDLAVLASGVVALTSRDRVVRLMSPDLGVELGRHQLARPDLLCALGEQRVVTAFDDTIEIWELGPDVGEPCRRLRTDAAIQALAVLSDGRIVTAHYDGTQRLWSNPLEPGAHTAGG